MSYARDYYEAILDILGSQSCIIPIGDARFENVARTTVTTKGRGTGDGLVFTYSEARTAWDGKSYQRGRGSVVFQPFNDSDEESDTPSIAFFSRNDAAGEAFSMGGWINLGGAGERTVLSKTDWGIQEEYQFLVRTDAKLSFVMKDESANVRPRRTSDAAMTVATQHFAAVTYDGAGGANAVDTVTLYLDGKVDPSTATNNASYVAMEGLTQPFKLGAYGATGDPFGGTMAGGPLGPFFTHSELTLQDVRKLQILGLEAQRDLPLLARIRGVRAA
jgi:hypothetical protein